MLREETYPGWRTDAKMVCPDVASREAAVTRCRVRLLERGDAHRLSWLLWGASREGGTAAPGLVHEAAIAFDPEDEQQALSMIDRIQVDGLRLRVRWLAGLRIDLRLLRHLRLPH